jgi:hypothetical protein
VVLNGLADYENNFTYPFLAKTNNLNAWTNDAGGNVGWYWQNNNASPTYTAGNALTSTLVGLYSFGDGDDRAMGNFGGLGNGTSGYPANTNTAWGVVFQNNTAQTITAITVAYTGEQWRGNNVVADSLRFSFKASSSAITDFVPLAGETPLGWTASPDLKFVTPVLGGTTALEGNNPANWRRLSATLPVTVLPGEFLALRWYDADDGGAGVLDSAMGVDDVKVSFLTSVVPEASSFWFGALMATVGLAGKAAWRLRT